MTCVFRLSIPFARSPLPPCGLPGVRPLFLVGDRKGCSRVCYLSRRFYICCTRYVSHAGLSECDLIMLAGLSIVSLIYRLNMLMQCAHVVSASNMFCALYYTASLTSTFDSFSHCLPLRTFHPTPWPSLVILVHSGEADECQV